MAVHTFARAGPSWLFFVWIADLLDRRAEGNALAEERVVISKVEKSVHLWASSKGREPLVEYGALQWSHFIVLVPVERSSNDPHSEQKQREPTMFILEFWLWNGTDSRSTEFFLRDKEGSAPVIFRHAYFLTALETRDEIPVVNSRLIWQVFSRLNSTIFHLSHPRMHL
jgi:hypothetical protein